MTLAPEGRRANLAKSLNAYFATLFLSTLGVQVHFPDDPGVFTPSAARWVRLDYLFGTTREWMGSLTDSGAQGNVVTGLININCCEIVSRMTDRYALDALQDAIRDTLGEGASIPIRDYATGGTPVVGYASIRATNENPVQDGRGADSSGIKIQNLSYTIVYLEPHS